MLNKQTMISIEDALPGREASMQIDDTHFVNQSSLTALPQAHQQQILLGMGCFWGAELSFSCAQGVVSTQVGYMGGYPDSTPGFVVTTTTTPRTATLRQSWCITSLRRGPLRVCLTCSGNHIRPSHRRHNQQDIRPQHSQLCIPIAV